MATFFGEVNEISSRAVWWSDEDDQVEDNAGPIKLTHDLVVKNKKLYEAFLSLCKVLYVSIGKPDPSERCVLQIKLKSINQKELLLSLSQLSSTEYWLSIDKQALKINSLTVQMVDYLGAEVLKKINSQYDLFLISKDLSNSNYIQYFSNHPNNKPLCLSELEKAYEMRSLISPETVKNQVELAVLEYCIVEKVNFVCVQLPSSYVEPSNLIPKQIVNSINEFTNLYYSNIIT